MDPLLNPRCPGACVYSGGPYSGSPAPAAQGPPLLSVELPHAPSLVPEPTDQLSDEEHTAAPALAGCVNRQLWSPK